MENAPCGRDSASLRPVHEKCNELHFSLPGFRSSRPLGTTFKLKMKLQHKTILGKIEVDFLNGIYSQDFKKKKIPWEEIVAIIKYDQPGVFRQRHLIGFAYQETDGSIYHGTLMRTGNKYKCLHFCEKIVGHLKKEHKAKGGNLWCARILNDNGIILDNITIFQAYIVCRMIADKMKVKWFEHTDDEEVEAAFSFLKNGLVRDGTEVAQILNVIDSAKFHIMRDGAINFFGSSGYRLLEDAKIKFSAQNAQQS